MYIYISIYIFVNILVYVCVHITNIIKEKEAINLRGGNGGRGSSEDDR